MAVKSSSNGKKSSSFNWSSIVLRCGKIYPELVNNFEKSERASTAVGNYHSHQEEINRHHRLPAIEDKSNPNTSTISEVNSVNNNLTLKSNSRPKSSPIDHGRLLLLPRNESKALAPRQPPPTPNKLNFWMIQNHVTSKINRQTLLLLQALRWVSLFDIQGDPFTFLYFEKYININFIFIKAPNKVWPM